MSEPFANFAKATILKKYTETQRKSLSGPLAALRLLEVALLNVTGDTCPTSISPAVMEEAVRLTKQLYSARTAYSHCTEFERIQRIANSEQICVLPFSWKNPVRPVETASMKVGPEFDRRREAELPSVRGLTALAEIFHVAADFSDIVVTGACAILCGAPGRISEPLRLHKDCEIEATDSKTSSPTYSLRWNPSKGGKAEQKWISTPMVDPARKAIARIRAATEPAREIAYWYERNPTKIFLHKDVEHYRSKEYLTMRELSEVLWGYSGKSATGKGHLWATREKLEKFRVDASAAVRFADVEKQILSKLPKGFPVRDERTALKYSDSLFVMRDHEMSSFLVSRCMFTPILDGHIATRLGQAQKLNRSIFEKHGYREDDGSPISVDTHDFRHLLNDMAQRGGMDEFDIARWSGRQNVAQNAAYDHVSDLEHAEILRLGFHTESPADGAVDVGPVRRLKAHKLVNRKQYSVTDGLTAHVTDFGVCEHDYTMLPCQNHQDCLSCDEHSCIKGWGSKEERIRQRRKELEMLVHRTRKAVADGEAGATVWLQTHEESLAHVVSLCEILDDPTVPDGSVIKLNVVPPEWQLERAARQREEGGIKLLESTATSVAPKVKRKSRRKKVVEVSGTGEGPEE